MNFARSIKYLLFSVFIGLSLTLGIRADGEVDLGFNASAQFRANGPVNKFLTQSDGKILVGGSFTVVNGIIANSIVRLNADGSLDNTFVASSTLKLVTVNAVAVQSDGKILVGFGGNNVVPGIQRLNVDGSKDTTFNDIIIQVANLVYDIKILPDGKFLAAGGFVYQSAFKNLVRFNSDGTRDSTFLFLTEGNVREVELLPDGKILAGGRFSANLNGFLYRLNSDGSIDSTLNTISLNGAVEDLMPQPDGKIIFSGAFQTVNNQPKGGIARVNGDGTFDASFNASNIGANGAVNEFVYTSDGKILIGGTFSLYNNVAESKVARLNADGSLDQTFATSIVSDATVTTLGFLGSGKILVGYSGGIINPFLPNGMSVLNADGSFDTTLVYNISKSSGIRRIAEQPDGKIIAGGNFEIVNNVPRIDLVRLNRDGSLDTSFNPVIDNGEVTAVALQPDGKILVGFNNTAVRLRRLNADGSVDAGFNYALTDTTAINDIVVVPNGKILIGGNFAGNIGVVRLNADGTQDNAFNYPSGASGVYKLLIEPDGRILVGRAFGIQRITADGFVDGTFNTNLSGTAFDLARLPDGRIIAVGAFTRVNGDSTKRNIARLTNEGVLDRTFTASTDAYITRVKIQSDRKIVIAGIMAFTNGIFRAGMARLNADGSLDTTFTANANDEVSDFIFSGNKIIASGFFTSLNDISRIGIARLNNNVSARRTAFDFDGDGRTDIGVYRPSNSVWYQYLGVNYQFSSVGFGLAEDILAPADYDGDGKTDLGIYRPSTSVFWYRSTAQGNAFRAIQWGQTGDIPLPSDFDGNGKDDFVLFRPSNNTWYRLSDSGVTSAFAFGTSGDKPLIGDFDGDGKADYAIFRPSTGVFWYAASSQNNAFRAVQFGANGDVPVPSDYDGDGKTDFAVYRPSNGGWYILNSANNSVTSLGFGANGDKPVAGDYDGDGKADIAVYRPSNGGWYLLRSTAGFTGIQLGVSTDIPLPNAFLSQ